MCSLLQIVQERRVGVLSVFSVETFLIDADFLASQALSPLFIRLRAMTGRSAAAWADAVPPGTVHQMVQNK